MERGKWIYRKAMRVASGKAQLPKICPELKALT